LESLSNANLLDDHFGRVGGQDVTLAVVFQLLFSLRDEEGVILYDLEA
jgi:hypothetical protein